MTDVTAEGIRRVFASIGCAHIASLLEQLSAIPRERIKFPFAVEMPLPTVDNGKEELLRLVDLLDPSDLTARRGSGEPMPVQSIEYLELLLRRIPRKRLLMIDSGSREMKAGQFYDADPGS